MRLLIGVHMVPTYGVGGAGRVALTLAHRLARRHEVTLFHPMPHTIGPVGTEHRRVEFGVRLIGRVLTPPNRFLDTFHLPEAEAWFRALLAEVRPDVVHFHHLTGLSLALPTLARRAGIPVVMTLHDYWLVCPRGQLIDLALQPCPGPGVFRCGRCLEDQVLLDRPIGRIVRAGVRHVPALRGAVETVGGRLSRYRRQAVQPAGERSRVVSRPGIGAARSMARRIAAAWEALDACTLLTAPSRHMIRSFRPWVKQTPLCLVRQSVGPRPARRPSIPPFPPLRIGFLGAMIPTKGPHVLLEASAKLSRDAVDVVLAGPTPLFHRQPNYPRRLERLAHVAHARLEPPVAPDRVPDWLSRLHLLIVPSIWMENAPLVIAEAFRVGVPVVASEVGGIPEMVRAGENGMLVPPGDVGALRVLLERIAAEPEEVRTWAEGAWRTRLPDPEIEATEWEQILDALRRDCG